MAALYLAWYKAYAYVFGFSAYGRTLRKSMNDINDNWSVSDVWTFKAVVSIWPCKCQFLLHMIVHYARQRTIYIVNDNWSVSDMRTFKAVVSIWPCKCQFLLHMIVHYARQRTIYIVNDNWSVSDMRTFKAVVCI